MITAHLPAAYLITTRLHRRWPEVPIGFGLFAGVFPDFDLLYFYLVDHRRTLHHHYWTHLPLFWLAAGAAGLLALRLATLRQWEGWAWVFLANVVGHLILDTVVGKIEWLAPLSKHEFYWFEVPARYSWWLWNFIFHWSFGFEVLVWLAALAVWQGRRQRVSAG